MRLALGVALALIAVAAAAGYSSFENLRMSPSGSSWTGGPAVIVTPTPVVTTPETFVPVFTPLPATATPAAPPPVAAVRATQPPAPTPVATRRPVPVPVLPTPRHRRD